MDSVQRIEALIAEDRHLSLRSIAESVELSHETVRSIMHNNLSRRYVCASWVPHHLSDHHKNLRVGCCKAIRKFLARNPDKYRLYAVEDETWIHFHPQKRKSANKAWVAIREKKPTVVRQALTNQKAMVLVIFTCNGKVNAQALPYGSHVNADIFKRFLIRTGEKWRTLRSDPTKLREVTIQFDNARPHRAKSITDFFSTRQVNALWQAPYEGLQKVLRLNMLGKWKL